MTARIKVPETQVIETINEFEQMQDPGSRFKYSHRGSRRPSQWYRKKGRKEDQRDHTWTPLCLSCFLNAPNCARDSKICLINISTHFSPHVSPHRARAEAELILMQDLEFNKPDEDKLNRFSQAIGGNYHEK